MKSNLSMGGPVTFPRWTGERVYMLPFRPSDRLPWNLERWQETVNQMMSGIDAALGYLMIDQGECQPGQTHRRAGLHVEGNWIAGIAKHDHVFYGGYSGAYAPELVVMASDALGCAAYLGDYHAAPGAGGDCSHVVIDSMRREELRPGRAYVADVATLHESLPNSDFCRRSIVRINVPL